MNSALDGLATRRLWSLWDMLRFYADDFVCCLNQLERLRVIAGNPEYVFDVENMSYVNSKIEDLIKHLGKIGCRVSLKKALNIKTMMHMNHKDKNVAAKIVQDAVEELRERIEVELEGDVFYYFSGPTQYLESKEPLFGTTVDDAFPKASEDIAEAGKCLALNRSTAVVFHLMRAMELSVQALYTKLGLSHDSEREWGKLLSDIGAAIEKMPKGDDRNAWSASHSHLYHVKQAFRNDVMHPKQTYTLEEAQEVFDAVKSFMRHLAGLV